MVMKDNSNISCFVSIPLLGKGDSVNKSFLSLNIPIIIGGSSKPDKIIYINYPICPLCFKDVCTCPDDKVREAWGQCHESDIREGDRWISVNLA